MKTKTEREIEKWIEVTSKNNELIKKRNKCIYLRIYYGKWKELKTHHYYCKKYNLFLHHLNKKGEFLFCKKCPYHNQKILVLSGDNHGR